MHLTPESQRINNRQRIPDWLITGLTSSPAEYLEHVRYYDNLGLHARRPETAAEIEALAEAMPGHRLIPRLSRQQLRDLGLSPYLLTGALTFPESWRERFCATLSADAPFRAAVAAFCERGAA